MEGPLCSTYTPRYRHTNTRTQTNKLLVSQRPTQRPLALLKRDHSQYSPAISFLGCVRLVMFVPPLAHRPPLASVEGTHIPLYCGQRSSIFIRLICLVIQSCCSFGSFLGVFSAAVSVIKT